MSNLPELAWEVKREILEMSVASQKPHLSSCLSVSDILVSLFEVKKSLGYGEVYLSKGHAALALYCVLKQFGVISEADLRSYCANGSIFEGHVNSRIDGVPLSTGSLGHALAFALGSALADSKKSIKASHWVVLSDGELNEGSNWESLLFAAHLQIPNLNVVIDRNRLQSLLGTEATVRLEPLKDKLEAFGWMVLQVEGHNPHALVNAMKVATSQSRPVALIAETTKGHPLPSLMSEGVRYHYKPADQGHLLEFQALLPSDKV